MASKTSAGDARYGIGAVARLTGLTDHTIRVWERRYGAVVAERAANGRRKYSPEDVEKLGLLKRLTDAGISISQVAGDSIAELGERISSLAELTTTPVPDRVRVAAFGESIAALLARGADIAPVEVVAADSNRERLVADLDGQSVDVVVLEAPAMDRDTLAELNALQKLCGARRGLMLYGFAASRNVEHARSSGVAVLRSPVDLQHLRDTLLQLASRAKAPIVPVRKAPTDPDSPWQISGPVPARRFSREQLATLASASTSIDCECPHHLADLVGSLSAFEVYSANCASRDDDDAALHRYLHRTTAEARALIEAALERVARAEGLSV